MTNANTGEGLNPSELVQFATLSTARLAQLTPTVDIPDAVIMLRAAANPDQPEAWTEGIELSPTTELTASFARQAIEAVRNGDK